MGEGTRRPSDPASDDLDFLVAEELSQRFQTKDGADERGHTTLRGAVDLMLRLTPDLKLESRKQRGEPITPLNLEMKRVDLRRTFPDVIEHDEAAEPLESVVMVVRDARQGAEGISEAAAASARR